MGKTADDMPYKMQRLAYSDHLDHWEDYQPDIKGDPASLVVHINFQSLHLQDTLRIISEDEQDVYAVFYTREDE